MAEITIHLTVTGEQGSPRVPLKVSTSISAADLLKRVSETTKIPPESLKLIFRGRLIASDENKVAAEEYKLEEGSVLHCIGKPVNEPSAASVSSADSSAATASASSISGRAATVPPFAAGAVSMPALHQAPLPTDPLLAALQAMRSANSPADYQTAIQVLEKLLGNIIEHPMEDKYRRVKKQNPAFQRRLGGITGGEAVLMAAGFVSEKDETGADVFMMRANPDAWPKLLETKAKVEQAVRQVNAARAINPTGAAISSPTFGSLPGSGGSIPPDMDRMRTAMLRNPAMMQNMLQSPMFQNMLRTDPRIANNPMMQRALQDPQMLAQLSQLMQDPQMMQQLETMMQNPQMMQQMEQQMQAMGMPPLGGGAGLPTGGAGLPNFLAPSAGMGANAGTAGRQQQSASDEDLTEEEMIAEAIRRSLQDQGPPS